MNSDVNLVGSNLVLGDNIKE